MAERLMKAISRKDEQQAIALIEKDRTIVWIKDRVHTGGYPIHFVVMSVSVSCSRLPLPTSAQLLGLAVHLAAQICGSAAARLCEEAREDGLDQ